MEARGSRMDGALPADMGYDSPSGAEIPDSPKYFYFRIMTFDGNRNPPEGVQVT